MPCVICNSRKEKRLCPAVHDRICPQCCGTEREKSLECPVECGYLQQAHKQEIPRAPEDLKGEEGFPDVEISRKFYYDWEPLIGGLMAMLGSLCAEHPEWHDRDVIDALIAIARNYRRLAESGIIYEETVPSVVQRAIGTEIQKNIDEYRAVEERQFGAFTLKDSDVMRVLIFMVRITHPQTTGRPKSRALVERLRATSPHSKHVHTQAANSGGIIIP